MAFPTFEYCCQAAGAIISDRAVEAPRRLLLSACSFVFVLLVWSIAHVSSWIASTPKNICHNAATTRCGRDRLHGGTHRRHARTRCHCMYIDMRSRIHRLHRPPPDIATVFKGWHGDERLADIVCLGELNELSHGVFQQLQCDRQLGAGFENRKPSERPTQKSSGLILLYSSTLQFLMFALPCPSSMGAVDISSSLQIQIMHGCFKL